eukprot:gene9973-2149_t
MFACPCIETVARYTSRRLLSTQFSSSFQIQYRKVSQASQNSLTILGRKCSSSSIPAVALRQKNSFHSYSYRGFPKSNSQRKLHSSHPQRSIMNLKQLYANWTQPKPEPLRFSQQWWKVWAIRFIVFAITGSSSVKFATPLLDTFFGIKGSWLEGPWSFRIASAVFVTPIYTAILLLVGTIFGQQYYFKHVALKLWSRLLPGVVKRPTPLAHTQKSSGIVEAAADKIKNR